MPMQQQRPALAVPCCCAACGTCHGDEGALPHAVQRPGVRPVLGEGAVHEPRPPRQRGKLRCRVLSGKQTGALAQELPPAPDPNICQGRQ